MKSRLPITNQNQNIELKNATHLFGPLLRCWMSGSLGFELDQMYLIWISRRCHLCQDTTAEASPHPQPVDIESGRKFNWRWDAAKRQTLETAPWDEEPSTQSGGTPLSSAAARTSEETGDGSKGAEEYLERPGLLRRISSWKLHEP